MVDPEALVIKTATATLTALCVLQLAMDTALARDSLAIGSLVAERRGGGSWISKQEASRFIGASADSLWMCNVEPNPNLAISLEERGGPALEAKKSPFDFTIRDLEAGRVVVDGSGTTASGPGDATSFPIAHTSPPYLDQGDDFQINRIRLFPCFGGRNERRFLHQFEVAMSASLLPSASTPVFPVFPPQHSTGGGQTIRQPHCEVREELTNVRAPRGDCRNRDLRRRIAADGNLPVRASGVERGSDGASAQLSGRRLLATSKREDGRANGNRATFCSQDG